MNYVTFQSATTAARFSSDIDSDIGYPRAGTNVGGGMHVTPTFVTLRYGDVFKHPDRDEWAYLDDATVVARRARVPLPPLSQSRTLERDWFPVVPTPPGLMRPQDR